MAAQTSSDGALGVLTPVAALELLDIGDAGIGYLNSAIGIGRLIGSLAAAGMVGRDSRPGSRRGLVLWGAADAIVGVLTGERSRADPVRVVGRRQHPDRRRRADHAPTRRAREMIARAFGVLETLILTPVALGSLMTPLLLDLIGNEATFL